VKGVKRNTGGMRRRGYIPYRGVGAAYVTGNIILSSASDAAHVRRWKDWAEPKKRRGGGFGEKRKKKKKKKKKKKSSPTPEARMATRDPCIYPARKGKISSQREKRYQRGVTGVGPAFDDGLMQG